MLNITNLKLYKNKVANYNKYFSSGLVELYCLHKLFKYKIFIYDKYQVLSKVIDGKIVTTNLHKYNKNNSIHIRVIYTINIEIPNQMDVMYLS